MSRLGVNRKLLDTSKIDDEANYTPAQVRRVIGLLSERVNSAIRARAGWEGSSADYHRKFHPNAHLLELVPVGDPVRRYLVTGRSLRVWAEKENEDVQETTPRGAWVDSEPCGAPVTGTHPQGHPGTCQTRVKGGGPCVWHRPGDEV